MNKKECRLKEVRAVEDADKMIVEGYAVVYDSPTDMGGWIEVVDSGALDNTNMDDVCMKYNHEDTYLIMARTRNGSLQLDVDEKGLRVRAELIDTQSNRDIYKAIQSRLLDKMSFAFIVEDANWDTIDGVDVRHIKRISRLFDVSVVDIPAYESTDIYARSNDAVAEEREQYLKDKEAKQKLELEKQKLLLKLSL